MLPPEEYASLERTGIPLFPGIRQEDVAVVVVEDGGKVVACMSVLRATHFEGAWIDPEHRNAGVTRGLLNLAKEIAKSRWENDWVFAGAADDKMRDVIGRLGGVALPMDSFVLSLGGEECRKPS